MPTEEPTPQQIAAVIKRLKNKGGCGCDGCDKSCKGVCGQDCGGTCCGGGGNCGGGGGVQSQGEKPPIPQSGGDAPKQPLKPLPSDMPPAPEDEQTPDDEPPRDRPRG